MVTAKWLVGRCGGAGLYFVDEVVKRDVVLQPGEHVAQGDAAGFEFAVTEDGGVADAGGVGAALRDVG